VTIEQLKKEKQMPKRSAAGQRNFGLEGSGKGDADRSPGWRDKYDDIDWERSDSGVDDGFRRIGTTRFIKLYGVKTERLLNEQSDKPVDDV
jgi:hypothetical protein